MSSENITTTKTDSPAPEKSAESAIEHAKRAFALKKYEQAVDYYATALELVSEKLGEDSPEIADLYFAYGKALLENAISQSSVLGKEKQEDERDDVPKASDASTSKNGPVLSFSGDAEDVEEDPAVDLFAQATEAVAEADAEEAENAPEDEDDEDAEPEDDFNAAWEVLDLARTIYDKQHDTDTSDESVALKLAETYITLGDVSLETEKFDQAITDYETGLLLKSKLLPFSSRQIAEAHYKLSIVLDLTSGRLADAITHAEKALQSIRARLDELEQVLSNPVASEAADEKPDPKGKGKAPANQFKDESVKNLTSLQIELEMKELRELMLDLALKIEELKSSPNEVLADSAPAMVAQALDKELGAASASPSVLASVNDLTSMVRKKKAPAPDASPAKRKAEDDDNKSDGLASEKKPKLDTPGAS